MIALGPIGFLQPWLLAGLAALPAIWWLLRMTPPRPKTIVFPPTRLLKDLVSREETPAHSPWWLTALRMLLAALLILALARPVLNPDRQPLAGTGPVLLVVDNGWASGAQWDQRTEALASLIDRAERDGRPVILATTAPGDAPGPAEGASEARDRATALAPQPFAPNRGRLAGGLRQQLGTQQGLGVVWLSDGLDHGGTDAFTAELTRIAGGSGVTVLQPEPNMGALALNATTGERGGLGARIIAATDASRSGVVTALSARGESLGEASFAIAPGTKDAKVGLDLPLEIRNQVARLEILGERSAGAVNLVDSRSRWQRVGMISGEAREEAQPLLSPLYYVQRALNPFSEVISSKETNVALAVDDLLAQKATSLVMADIGNLPTGLTEKLGTWMQDGGVVIRFAGPRLEQSDDGLLPVELRRGGRTLGGSLSWSTPQPLAGFEEGSPFRGLAIPPDVSVARQVLADPIAADQAQVWARLTDGTPLVTAEPRGKGWIVLFHVTANSDWSNLPLSGLFVDMLRRIVAMSTLSGTPDQKQAGQTTGAAQSSAQTALVPTQTLDGFGRLGSPPQRATAIASNEIDALQPSAEHPPGYYGPAGASRALNLINDRTVLRPHANLGAQGLGQTYSLRQAIPLDSWLLIGALGLFLADILAMLILSSGFRFRRRARQAAVVMLAVGLGLGTVPPRAFAQGTPPGDADFAMKAALQTRLAYVVTGDGQVDQTSEQGLKGLTKVLQARTALEASDPLGVDPRSDELAFFPILYWPVLDSAEPLDDTTLAKIDAYMKQGGLVIFDTRDYQTVGGAGLQNSPALGRLIGRLDLPPLEPVPENHVLTKSFYLLRSFPGRYDGGTLWVQATPEDEAGSEQRARHADGVSSILVTSNDMAAAWALDDRNRPLYPAVPGGEVQREMAFRSGVNIVMYALTGNYKADQVHVPALLERLGQ